MVAVRTMAGEEPSGVERGRWSSKPSGWPGSRAPIHRSDIDNPVDLDSIENDVRPASVSRHARFVECGFWLSTSSNYGQARGYIMGPFSRP